ncbi:hypothetical protein BD413DRAFT_151055 [Trametes elegans]|nr:hypothetical protein BD413DRAFT_151055 [Trametes elegans]
MWTGKNICRSQLVGGKYKFLGRDGNRWYVGALVHVTETAGGERATLLFLDGTWACAPLADCTPTAEPISREGPPEDIPISNALSEDLLRHFPQTKMPPPGTLPVVPGYSHTPRRYAQPQGNAGSSRGHSQWGTAHPKAMPLTSTPYYDPRTTMRPPAAAAPSAAVPGGSWQGYGGATPTYSGHSAPYPGQHVTGGGMRAPARPAYGPIQVPPGFQTPSVTSLSSSSRSSDAFSLSGYYAASSTNNDSDTSSDEGRRRGRSSSNRRASSSSASHSGAHTSDRTGRSQTRK